MPLRRGSVLAGMLSVALFVAAAPASASVATYEGFKYVTKSSIVLKPGDYTRIKVGCPGDTHGYGGGQSNPATYNVIWQTQSYPIDDGDAGHKPDDGWGMLVFNRTGSEVEADAYAVCGKPNAIYSTKAVSVGPNAYSPELDKYCNEKQLVGGGISGPERLAEDDGGPTVYMPGGPVYYAYLHNTSGAKEAAGLEYAVCAAVKTAYPGNGDQVTQGTQLGLLADCPANSVALSGGMSSTGGVALNSSYPVNAAESWRVFGDNTSNANQSMGALAVCGKHP